jgi:hypothetical protein
MHVSHELYNISLGEASGLLRRQNFEQFIIWKINEVLSGKEGFKLIPLKSFLCWFVSRSGFKRFNFWFKLFDFLTFHFISE